jgi:hypothetical protein
MTPNYMAKRTKNPYFCQRMMSIQVRKSSTRRCIFHTKLHLTISISKSRSQCINPLLTTSTQPPNLLPSQSCIPLPPPKASEYEYSYYTSSHPTAQTVPPQDGTQKSSPDPPHPTGYSHQSTLSKPNMPLAPQYSNS